MATPSLTKHRIPGVFGDLLIDVRSGGRAEPRSAVIVLHGFKGFKDWGMFPPLADRLARAGFAVISFNLSGSGVDDQGDFSFPEKFGHNTFSAEVTDLSRVINALARGQLGVPEPPAIGVIGHSRGGGTAILSAAIDPRIAALVTWSAISTVERWSPESRAEWRRTGKTEIRNARTGEIFPLYTDVLTDLERHAAGSLDIRAAAAKVSTPWLLIHGTNDEAVPIREAELLSGLATIPTLAYVPVDGAGHTFGAVHPFAGMTTALDRVFQETVDWFSLYLP